MGHVRDLWMEPGPKGRKVRSARYGHGNRWLARWSSRGREHSRSFPSKDAATAFLAKVAAGDVVVRKDAPPVGDVLQAWLAGQLHLRDQTRAHSELCVQRLIDAQVDGATLGEIRLDRLTRQDVQQAVADLSTRLGASTVRVTYSHLTAACKQAVLDGLIAATPCTGVRLPKVERRPVRVLTPAQVQEIIGRLAGDFRAMGLLAVATGMRGGELRGLSRDRVHGRMATVDRQLLSAVPLRWGPPKTAASHRTLDIAATGEAALATLTPHPDGLLFHTRRGTPIGKPTAISAWQRATEGMGLGKGTGWHSLRHFHASLLIASGMSARAVADRLGHDDPGVTQRVYTHLWPTDEARSVAAIDRTLLGLSPVPSCAVTASAEGAA